MTDVDAIRQQRLAMLEQLVEDNPEDGFGLYGLAIEYRQLGRAEEAEGLLRRAIAVDADHFYAYYQLGELLMAAGRREEAREVITAGQGRAEAAGQRKAASELSALARGV